MGVYIYIYFLNIRENVRRKVSACCVIFEGNKNVYGNNLSSTATFCHIVLKCNQSWPPVNYRLLRVMITGLTPEQEQCWDRWLTFLNSLGLQEATSQH